jgi:hypothetical protein
MAQTTTKRNAPASSPTQTPKKRVAASGAAAVPTPDTQDTNDAAKLQTGAPPVSAQAAGLQAQGLPDLSAVAPKSVPSSVLQQTGASAVQQQAVQTAPQSQTTQQQAAVADNNVNAVQPQNAQQGTKEAAVGDNAVQTSNDTSAKNNGLTHPNSMPSGSLQDASQSPSPAVPQVVRDGIRRSPLYAYWIKREPSMTQDKINAYRQLLNDPSAVSGYDMNEVDALRVFLDDQQASLDGKGYAYYGNHGKLLQNIPNPNYGNGVPNAVPNGAGYAGQYTPQSSQYGFGQLTADIPNQGAGKAKAIAQPVQAGNAAANTGTASKAKTDTNTASSSSTAGGTSTTTTKTTTTTHPSGGSTTKTVTESREKTRTKGAPTASAVSETPYKESDKEEAELWRKRNETNAKRIEEDKAYQKELEDKYGKQRAAAKEEYDKAVRDAANAPSMHEYIDSVQKAMSADQSLKELDPKQKKRRRALKIVSMIADIFGALANYKAVSDGKLNVAQKSLTAQLEAEDKATSEYRQKRLDYWQKRLAEAQKSDAAADRLLRSKRLDQLLQEYKGRLSDISTSQKGEQSLRSATVGQSRKAEDNAWAAQFKGVETRKSQAQKGEQDRATKRTEPGMQRYSYTTNRTSTSTANVNFNGKSGGSKKKKGGGANTSAEKKKENSLFFGDGKKKK